MNAAAANALYEAERKGVRQIRGTTRDHNGGVCAMGAIQDLAGEMAVTALVRARVARCPLCDTTEVRATPESHPHPLMTEWDAVVHLNDDHGLTFCEIARKLGPDAA